MLYFKSRYDGLQAGQAMRVRLATPTATASNKTAGGAVAVTPPAAAPMTRFFGTVKLDPARPVRDAERVIQEVVQHLTAMAGAEVEIRVEDTREGGARRDG